MVISNDVKIAFMRNNEVDGALLQTLGATVARNLLILSERIASATPNPETVTLIGVTKGFGPEAAIAAMDNGIILLGENYADELVCKSQIVARFCEKERRNEPQWHFQGRLQTNKINKLRSVVSVWQSVDSPDRLDALAKRCPGASILLQINLTQRENRGGLAVENLTGFLHRANEAGVKVLGLMGLGPEPVAGYTEASAVAFRLLDSLCRAHDLSWRSMGMSGDLETAIRNGATHIRIGTALFGAREP